MPADEHVFGVVTSKRRHIIIDAVAMTISIARRLNITGPILDIGCHAGFLPDVASQFVDAEFMGIDPVVEAIQFGSRRLLSSGRVELVCASVPWQTERQFPMIVTVDACPSSRSDRGPFLAGVGKLLSRGGIALVISRYLLDPDPTPLRRQLKRADLGYAFADIVGGYGGAPTEFFVEGVLCLIKESPRQLPSKLQSHMQSDWSSFRNYANDPLTPDREKTQSFERAQRVVRSTQIGSALVVN